MSVGPVKDLANIEYGGFYIPVASWLFIYQQTRNFDFIIFLMITVLGAVIWHSIFRSIFGAEGPRKNPKKRLAVAGYSLALMYKREPGGNPNSLDELGDRIRASFTIRRGIRFAIFSFVCFGYIALTLYSIIPLYEMSINSGSLIGGVLLLSQIIFILQGFIVKRVAPVVPPESFEWGFVPEFRRLHEEFKDDEEKDDDSPYIDHPYILDEIRDSLKDSHYRKGEMFLQSSEYSNHRTESSETKSRDS